MRKVIRKSLIVLLAIAVTVTFTPMFSFGNAFAAAKIKAPATFSGTAPSAKAIKLTWSQSKGAKKYVIYKNGKKFKTVSKTSFTDKKVKKGKIYKYKVKAMKGKKLSPATYVIKIKAAKGMNATKVKLNKTTAAIPDIGKTVKLTAKLTPAKAVKGIVWTSSNKRIATVKAGKVTGKKAGTVTITARAASGKTAKCRITVRKAPRVAAPTGTYVGVENKGVQEFKGIRYGTFRPFLPAGEVTTTTEDVIYATNYGPNCLQPWDEVEVSSQDPCSHDCLFLNIWTKDPTTANKPVIFWIHGGGYTAGGSSDPMYNGEYFVRNLPDGEDVVLVTMNYRLSFLGSLDLSGLEGYTDAYRESRNLTKLDQIQALKWVQENISAFGGDKDNVTVMGHSSGSAGVNLLLADDSANNYFRRAIAASGIPQHVMISKEECKANSNDIFEILNVKTVDELTALSDADIMSKIDKIYEEVNLGGIVADDIVISKTYYDDLMEGSAKDIDYMSGCTSGEWDSLALDWRNLPEATDDYMKLYNRSVESNKGRKGTYSKFYTEDIESVLDKYLALYEDKVMAMMDYINDRGFCAEQLICDRQSQYNNNTYFYYWEYAPKNTDVMAFSGDAAEISPWSRPLHGMDMCFAFGTLDDGYLQLTGDPNGHPENLVRDWQTSLYNYAKTGNPNNEYVDTWIQFDGNKRNVQVISPEGKFSNEAGFREDAFSILKEVKMNGVINQ